MLYKNSITVKLNINYPIIQAGMAGGVTTPELVAAVSNAGALGTLGAGYLSPEKTRQAIHEIKQLTEKPFAVNLFVPEEVELEQSKIDASNLLLEGIREELKIEGAPDITKPDTSLFNKQIEVLIEERVPICSFTFGVPCKKIIENLKAENITLIGTATTVEEAIANEKSGMDMVTLQGSEAGGHRGSFLVNDQNPPMIGTMALVPQAVDHVKIPVIAAGGIMDGRGVIAALMLGAEAVQMGTAFLTTLESGAHPKHKGAILETSEEDTVITKAFSGKPARGIRNDFIKKLEKDEDNLPDYPLQNSLTQGIRQAAAKQNRPEYLSLWSGQNPRLSKTKQADELVRSILKQIEELVGQMKGIQ